MMHNAKPANYDEAVRFFEMAMKRSGSDSGANYVVSSFFRAKAKGLVQKNIIKDERVALLQVLFEEWEKNQKSGAESGGRDSIYNQNLNDRLIKALKDVKFAYAAGEKFCASCGKPVQVWGLCKVAACKAPLKGGSAAFCSTCGAKQN